MELDLEQTITDAVNDATFSDEVDTPDVEASAPAEVDTPEVTPPAEVETPETYDSQQVVSPAAQKPAEVDEFAKLAGIPQMGVAGKENRIPYSRVKKITEKAVNDVAEVALGRKLNPGERASDVIKTHVAQIPTLKAQVTDYETRLNTVGEFENVMATNPQRFLHMLATIPVYKEFFTFVEDAWNRQQGTPQPNQVQSSINGQSAPNQPATDEMPQPDEKLPDGSLVYSIKGLQDVLEWKAKQVAGTLSKQFDDRYSKLEERYRPMETEFQAHQRMQATLPIVRQQIAKAREWPLFTDNEPEIIKALESDKTLSLDEAYRTVVFPKILADRSKIREDVIRDLQRAPAGNTSVATRSATKPNSPNVSTGPKTLEQIIQEQVDTLK